MRLIDNGVNYFTLKTENVDSLNEKEGGVLDKQNSNIDVDDFSIKKVESDEDFLKMIKEYIKDRETISISRIQAEFAVGYPKARKMIGMLESEGLIEMNNQGIYDVKKF